MVERFYWVTYTGCNTCWSGCTIVADIPATLVVPQSISPLWVHVNIILKRYCTITSPLLGRWWQTIQVSSRRGKKRVRSELHNNSTERVEKKRIKMGKETARVMKKRPTWVRDTRVFSAVGVPDLNTVKCRTFNHLAAPVHADCWTRHLSWAILAHSFFKHIVDVAYQLNSIIWNLRVCLCMSSILLWNSESHVALFCSAVPAERYWSCKTKSTASANLLQPHR